MFISLLCAATLINHFKTTQDMETLEQGDIPLKIPQEISSQHYTSREVTKKSSNHTQIRTFDRYGYRRRVFGIVVDSKTKQVLLTSATGTAGAFILPGGGIDPGETPEQSVIREVLEECGVTCKIIKYCRQVLDDTKKQRSWVFVCEKIEENDDCLEKNKRTRQWLDVEAASNALKNHKADQALLLTLI